MQEQHIKLPPWTKKRRVFTTIVLTCFILSAGGFIGLGLFQIGVTFGILKPQMTKDSLLLSLLNDGQFIRTVRHAAQLKVCSNKNKGFTLTYSAPLHLGKVNAVIDDCTILVTTHPNGSTVMVTLKKENIPREKLVLELSHDFSTVHTDILSGTAYETSVMNGNRNGVVTTLYVINAGLHTSWVISYLPTSPIFDGNVLELVERFRLI